jgi:hypothetical protein
MNIRDFLVESNKQLAIALMNPLYRQKEDIKSATFEEKIVNLGKEYLKALFIKK